jgi:hypothetical protein
VITILSITVSDRKFALGAVYGPNNNDLNFNDDLHDVINMQNIPSKQRSEKLYKWLETSQSPTLFNFSSPKEKSLPLAQTLPPIKTDLD